MNPITLTGSFCILSASVFVLAALKWMVSSVDIARANRNRGGADFSFVELFRNDLEILLFATLGLFTPQWVFFALIVITGLINPRNSAGVQARAMSLILATAGMIFHLFYTTS